MCKEFKKMVEEAVDYAAAWRMIRVRRGKGIKHGLSV